MLKVGLPLLALALAAASPAHAITDPAVLANDLLGPSFTAPAYICPGSMDLLHVMQEAAKEIAPVDVARTMKRALHAHSCHRESGKYVILQTFEATQINQGIGEEIWFQLQLQTQDGRIVYALVGVNQN
jgi:hypothetical protein